MPGSVGQWTRQRGSNARARIIWLVVLCVLVLSGCASGATTAKHGVPAGTATKTPTNSIGSSTFNKHPTVVIDALPQYIASMPLDVKLGQLFLAQLDGADFSPTHAAMIAQLHAGGILLYADNFVTAQQSKALIAAAQADAQIPLLTTIDEEGGWVDRLQSIYGFRPSAQMIGASGDPNYARSQGEKAAQDMSALGLNFNLAPDVDVGLVPGQDLRTRVFGSDPQTVSIMAAAYLQGLQSSGKVAGTLKHFPGLGSVLGDAHLDLPTVHRTLTELQQVELAPYQTLIDSGQVRAVMSTDVLVPALDPVLPAELSPAIINGYLRGVLGFQGVVVTDALYMAGISATYSMPQAAVLAIEAGDDLLIGPSTPSEMSAMISALQYAVQSGQISMQRIDQSVQRILLLKIHLGLMKMPTREIQLPENVQQSEPLRPGLPPTMPVLAPGCATPSDTRGAPCH